MGIDNVIFVSIILNRLKGDKEQKGPPVLDGNRHSFPQPVTDGVGLVTVAKGKAVFSIAGKGFDLASIVMLAGGLFLIYKSVMEIHHKLEGEDPNELLKIKAAFVWTGHQADPAY